MILTCSNIQKIPHTNAFQFLHIGVYPMSTIKHESIVHIPIVLQSNIVQIGAISPTHHLDHFEHIAQKPIVKASNNNSITLAKSSQCYVLNHIIDYILDTENPSFQ